MRDKKRRWYAKHATCENDPALIAKAQGKLRVDIFREIVDRGAALDLNRPLEQFVIADTSDDSNAILIARVGVLVTVDEAQEWELDEWLQLMIKVDDRLTAGYDADAKAHGHDNPELWERQMRELQGWISQRCDELQVRKPVATDRI